MSNQKRSASWNSPKGHIGTPSPYLYPYESLMEAFPGVPVSSSRNPSASPSRGPATEASRRTSRNPSRASSMQMTDKSASRSASRSGSPMDTTENSGSPISRGRSSIPKHSTTSSQMGTKGSSRSKSKGSPLSAFRTPECRTSPSPTSGTPKGLSPSPRPDPSSMPPPGDPNYHPRYNDKTPLPMWNCMDCRVELAPGGTRMKGRCGTCFNDEAKRLTLRTGEYGNTDKLGVNLPLNPRTRPRDPDPPRWSNERDHHDCVTEGCKNKAFGKTGLCLDCMKDEAYVMTTKKFMS